MRHTFFTVTVINRWNNLPRDVVDSLSFKCFTSTLDTFQRDKPMSQTDAENTGWGFVLGLQEISLDAYQSCSALYLDTTAPDCSAPPGPIISSHPVHPWCAGLLRLNKCCLQIHLPLWQAKWKPSQGRYGYLHRYSVTHSLSGIITAGDQNTPKLPISTRCKTVWALTLTDASIQRA